MNWKELYQSRRMSAQEAAGHIQDGDRIVVAHGFGAPTPILQAIADNYKEYQDVTFYEMAIFGDKPHVKKEFQGHLHLNALFVADGYRGALEEGWVDFTPMHFHRMPAYLEHQAKTNVVLVVTTPPDENGYVCCGLNSDYTMPAARHARTIIAEVNPHCPRINGDCFLHVSEVECFVETDRVISANVDKEPSEAERSIGGYCGELIKDGDVLQLGIGTIPDAVLPFLLDKKDLGIHSEVIGDGVQTLMEAGVLTGRRKTLHKGQVVTSSMFGSQKFHEFANNHPAFLLMPVDYTNDVRVIAQNDNMVSINSCIQVDLYGQINSECIGDRQFSGIGGQVDFVRGAQMAKGGRAIIACTSTAKGGSISKIVPYLDHGAAVTTSRCDADYIVTEYGIAALQGLTMYERAKAMISVAHPKFRDQLTEELERRYRRPVFSVHE